nr:hypothetical protein BgiMline_031759 [Biomphalaria glabrata]
MKAAAIVLIFIALSCVCDAVPAWHSFRSGERLPCEMSCDQHRTLSPVTGVIQEVKSSVKSSQYLNI